MEDDTSSNIQPHMTASIVTDEETGVPSEREQGQPQGQASRAAENAIQMPQSHQNMGGLPNGAFLDMSNVAAALPEYMYRQTPQNMYQQSYVHPGHGSPMIYPYQGAQYATNAQGNYSMTYANQLYPQGFSQQRPYPTYPTNPNIATGQQMFHGQPFFPQQAAMSSSYSGSYSAAPQTQAYVQGPGQMYGTRSPNRFPGTPIRTDNFGNSISNNQGFTHHDVQDTHRRGSATPSKIPSPLRGPPRKPKQSGHALWVGNLPPGTNIMELKDHFSRDATDDIESVFLISKSNCAFVNYKSEQSCTAAMGRFHDSRFNGVRLVCRLRRGSGPNTVVGPPSTNIATVLEVRGNPPSDAGQVMFQEEVVQVQNMNDSQNKAKVKEKYFIIKSLTIEDLERSVHSGIWATQSHNEDTLNQAYQSAENVYLIFSANKSGEYFGYARMDSAIDDESAASIDSSSFETQTPQQPSSAAIAEIPLTIPTSATATAPKGYVIDDSARGTIFWEADLGMALGEGSTADASPTHTDSGELSGEETVESDAKASASGGATGSSTTFGKPFRITWISTDRLPFYRTRGLRNPWNTNREVKIARDGTELEPGVGRKLVGMFTSGITAARNLQAGQYADMMQQIPGQGPAYRPY